MLVPKMASLQVCVKGEVAKTQVHPHLAKMKPTGLRVEGLGVSASPNRFSVNTIYKKIRLDLFLLLNPYDFEFGAITHSDIIASDC